LAPCSNGVPTLPLVTQVCYCEVRVLPLEKERKGLMVERAESQPIAHLLYQKAVDLRICLILSKLDFKVKPFSTIEKFHKESTRNGLLVVDVDSDLESGADIVENLVAQYEQSLVVCFCTNGSIDFFRRCFRVGVVDVLDKSFDDQRVTEALSSIRASRCRRPSLFASLRQRQLRYESLTDREREVFRHLVDGLTNREIGQLLSLSPRTVEVHRAHVQEKLHVRNTAQMAAEYSELIMA
jgi:two-component system response regulator FixJ